MCKDIVVEVYHFLSHTVHKNKLLRPLAYSFCYHVGQISNFVAFTIDFACLLLAKKCLICISRRNKQKPARNPRKRCFSGARRIGRGLPTLSDCDGAGGRLISGTLVCSEVCSDVQCCASAVNLRH